MRRVAVTRADVADSGWMISYRHDEPRIEVVERARPWSLDGDGALSRLVAREPGDEWASLGLSTQT